jgi:hypothetical protein
MKYSIFSLFLCALTMAGCIKNDDPVVEKTVAEFDAATWNTAATGVSYPALTRVAPFGRPILTSGPNVNFTINRNTGTLRLRVNLVGPPSVGKSETVGYQVFTLPFSTIAFPATATGQTPTLAAATLSMIPAVSGTHYAPLSGKVSIPADSSWGYLDLQILNAGANAGKAAGLGIRLDSTGTILPSVNYRELGIIIDQR